MKTSVESDPKHLLYMSHPHLGFLVLLRDRSPKVSLTFFLCPLLLFRDPSATYLIFS